MQVSVPSPIQQTIVFSTLFLGILLLTLRKRPNLTLDLPTTQELKGFAIVAIIFSHIGYFLSTDHNFLFPLSVLAGVGVNLFLVLSGFGLSLSQMRRPLSITQFYKLRLKRLFILLWVILTIWYVCDFLILKKSFSLPYMLQSYLGLFESANLYTDVDSPLWYFTLILFYYLLFPWVFRNKQPIMAAPLLLLATFALTQLNLPYFWKTDGLYKLHLWAFPLGVLLATSLPASQTYCRSVSAFFLRHELFLKSSLVLSAVIAGYISVYDSGVGESIVKEQIMGLIVTFLLTGVFALKRYRVRLLEVFGKYSYEIYLIHWPLVYHYDVFYKVWPASLSTLLYLGVFLVAAAILQRLDRTLDRLKII